MYLFDVVIEAGLELVVQDALALRAEVEPLQDVPVPAHLFSFEFSVQFRNTFAWDV